MRKIPLLFCYHLSRSEWRGSNVRKENKKKVLEKKRKNLTLDNLNKFIKLSAKTTAIIK